MSNSPLYDDLMSVLQDGLTPHGFRRKGTSFLRDAGDVLHVVTVQRTVAPSPTAVEFTINAGVWAKAIGAERRPPTSTTGCHVWRRISDFMGRRDDLWWTLEGESETPAAVRDLVLEHVLSRLDPLRTSADLLSAWRAEPPRFPLPYSYDRERYFGLLEAAVS